MSPSGQDAGKPSGLRPLHFVPFVAFLALAGLFLLQLTSGRDGSAVPSVLIGQQAPATSLPPLLEGQAPFDTAALKGQTTLVNVWASWCVPCREEHPVLLGLAQDGRFALWGMNYKDDPAKASAFLKELGSPFSVIGVDGKGRAGIDWGVYGVPETYVVDRQGIIRFKHIGPLTPEIVREKILPEIEKALAATS